MKDLKKNKATEITNTKTEIKNTAAIKGGDHIVKKERQKPKPRVWIYSGR